MLFSWLLRLKFCNRYFNAYKINLYYNYLYLYNWFFFQVFVNRIKLLITDINKPREQGRRPKTYHDNGRLAISYNSYNLQEERPFSNRNHCNSLISQVPQKQLSEKRLGNLNNPPCNCNSLTIKQQGSFEREMGPVRGCEDKRRGIWIGL